MLLGYSCEWWTSLCAITPVALVVIIAAGIQIAIEAREVAAADFHP